MELGAACVSIENPEPLVKLKPRRGDFAYESDGSPLILDLYLLWQLLPLTCSHLPGVTHFFADGKLANAK